MGKTGFFSKQITVDLTINVTTTFVANTVVGYVTLPEVMRNAGGTGTLVNVEVIDDGRTGPDLGLYLFNRPITSQTIQSSLAVTASNGRNYLHYMGIANGDYKFLNISSTALGVAKESTINELVEAHPDFRDLGLVVTADAASINWTATNANLRIRLGFYQD